jgi:hypothetical protein
MANKIEKMTKAELLKEFDRLRKLIQDGQRYRRVKNMREFYQVEPCCDDATIFIDEISEKLDVKYKYVVCLGISFVTDGLNEDDLDDIDEYEVVVTHRGKKIKGSVGKFAQSHRLPLL